VTEKSEVHCMRKEMVVIPVNRAANPKRRIGKNGGSQQASIRRPLKVSEQSSLRTGLSSLSVEFEVNGS
jgi:hypothetical protein